MAMSEEMKQKARERMQAYHAAKKEEKKLSEVTKDEPVVPEPQEQENVQSDDLKALLAHVKELEAKVAQLDRKPTEQPTINQHGSVTGTFEKFTVDPNNYPDPTDRLKKEKRLAPLAFDINYELVYDVAVSVYETKDGINTKEPRFNIELHKIVLDDQGTDTGGRYVVRKLMFHEDPQSALIVARDNGVEPNDFGSESLFLDEMRYLKARDWLIDIFFPVKADKPKITSERVYGNQLVQFFEKTSDTTERIPFDKLR